MVNTYKLQFTVLQQEIFRLLCIKTGNKLSQRKIAGLLDVSATAVGKSVALLEKEKLIKISKSAEMNLNLIELDRKNATPLKRVINLELFYKSNILNKLIHDFPGCTIILFGSYAKGEDIFSSDIDIAVIGTKKKGKVYNVLEKEVRVSTYEDFKMNKELRENIFNGIVLAGRIEL